MIVINSADYIIPEFRTEFGLLPPCFLPLGNKKLLEYQVTYFREKFKDEKIYISLPNDYELSISEKELFKNLNIKYVHSPNNFSLGMTILYVLSTLDFEISDSNSIRILHGDTLLKNIPNDDDIVGVAISEDNYTWEFDKESGIDNLVWCGYFSFSSYHKLIQSLVLGKGNFIDSVRIYSEKKNLKRKIINDWLDFGHINTYFKSRSSITTARAFNNLKIHDGIVWKSGSPEQKILAEANWFKSLPKELKHYIPQLISFGYTDTNKPYYELEYLPYLPLNEIFVHGKNDTIFWNKIISRINNFMRDSRRYFLSDNDSLSNIKNDTMKLYREKTYSRLREYSESSGINLDNETIYNGKLYPSLNDIAEECISFSENQCIYPSIIHGDLCFSNILFDSRSDNVKVLDPRGMNLDKEFTIYGDQKYDLAKLCHSFIGMYDFIIADNFYIHDDTLYFNEDERIREIQKLFLETKFIDDLDTKDILPLTVLLFLSMTPLHSDKPHRQQAMIINAVRLYALWKSM